MFWDNWIPKKHLVKSEICAVEACFNDEGVMYYYTHLKNKNNKLDLSETGSCINVPELPKAIEKNKVPLLLIVNGKGVILKKINTGEDSQTDAAELIRQNLPAINADEFYIQLYKQNDTSAFIALCRKEQVDQELSRLKNKKYDIAGVLLGAPAIIGLQPLWANYNTIATSLHSAELTNGFLDVLSLNKNAENETLKIEGLMLPSQHTLGFAGGFSYLLQRKIAENINIEITHIASQHNEKNKLRFLMISIVVLAFTLAIVNVLFYTSYFDKNNKLETELSVYQGKYEQINKLLNDYQKNKSLIENAGVLNKNKLSEYGDKIGKTLPDEVVLSELYFNPKKDNDENEDSLVTFDTKHLVLKGNCSKSFIVNEWVNVLKMQKFIKDVSLERFTYSNEGILPNFEIKLLTE